MGLAYNLGDSRVYLYHREKLDKLTKDHTLADYLVELGIITEEQAENHPNKSSLTQFVGMEREQKVEPYFSDEIQLEIGDKVLICSDGLYNMVDNLSIAHMLGSSMSLSELGKALIERALAAGGADNVTLILISVEQQ